MKKKKIIPFINAENEYPENIIKLADEYACKGADELFIYNYTGDEASREEFLSTARAIEKQIDIPFMIGMYIERFEDAKKALYTGAYKLVIRNALLPEQEVIDEITSRFDKDKLMLEVDMKAAFMDAEALDKYYDMGVGSAMLKHIDCTKSFTDTINNTKMDIMIRDGLIRNDLAELLSFEKTDAVSTNYFEDTEDRDIYKA